MNNYDYIGSRREALDWELRHETGPARTSALATGPQLRYLRSLLAEANRVGYAHGYRYDLTAPGLLKVEASQAIDRLVGAKRAGWR